ncbi:ABC transporter substrate-binding protein [Halioxenophilus aromaticivorans]|uniref:ABC transporter substrate-binding protein n=1 Tax=Halioxenophilus aromaticivorans TaxID=1306992 RepID=A0AAV3U7M8_9ALTE
MRWQLHSLFSLLHFSWRLWAFWILFALCALTVATAADRTYADSKSKTNIDTIKVGVLQFGTVRWELDVIERHHIAAEHNVNIQVTPLASNQATLTALQSGAVDIIVADWIWAARQYDFGREFSFYPYSSSAASLMLAADSGIESFADLKGKKIGVAGGPVNKSWILYQAYARKHHQMNLQQDAVINFAAPPILNELVLKGELDAVINFWHFSARLEQRGLKQLVAMDQVLASLGITTPTPVLGWVFKTDWAEQHADVLNRFIAASYQARQRLLVNDQEWQQLTPLTSVNNAQLRDLLRDGYRAGIPRQWGPEQRSATQQLFNVLRNEAGADLAGQLTELPGTLFWKNSVLPAQ